MTAETPFWGGQGRLAWIRRGPYEGRLAFVYPDSAPEWWTLVIDPGPVEGVPGDLYIDDTEYLFLLFVQWQFEWIDKDDDVDLERERFGWRPLQGNNWTIGSPSTDRQLQARQPPTGVEPGPTPGREMAEHLGSFIEALAPGRSRVELRDHQLIATDLHAEPVGSAGAALDIRVGATMWAVTIADVVHSYGRLNDTAVREVEAIVRNVVNHGCRLVRIDRQRFIEIGAEVASRRGSRRVEREWRPWTSETM